ncbi:hypothetical protein C5167_041504 [Papaver somniferum]|nr:hypothetical protein C5167_041504 [Papaver somniferum]
MELPTTIFMEDVNEELDKSLKIGCSAVHGLPVSMPMIASSILRQQGLLSPFKEGFSRFLWISPLGVVNFAGYKLAQKEMDKR